MTRFAVITDVHADVHALRDAFKQIDSLGCDRVVCCGDVVDYSLFPEETIALLRERQVMTIRGNHDRWAVQEGVDMSGWELTPAAMHFLESLPTHHRSLIEGVRVVFEHARPESDMRGIATDEPEAELRAILKDASADVLIVGHTHQPFVRRVGVGKVVINPGALLRNPAPGVEVLTPGTFAVVEIDRGVRATVRRAATGEAVIAGR